MQQTIFHSKIDQIACFLIITSVFFLPFSPTLNNLFLLAAALTFFGGQLTEKSNFITSYAMTWFGLVLLILYAASIFYSHYSASESLKGFWKEAHLFLALLAMPLFVTEKARQRALQALVLSACLSAIMVTMQHFHLVDWRSLLFKHRQQLFPPIPYSIFLAFTCFLLLNQILDNRQWRTVRILVLLFLGYVLFFINIERTGVLVLLGLLVLICWQRLNWRWFIVGILGIAFLSTALYYLSPNMQQRIKLAVHEVATYQQQPDTSIGIRLTFIRYSIDLIKQDPWFGKGAGRYADGKGDLPLDPTLQQGRLNPENSYLRIALELGLVGLLAFILWLAASWYDTRFLRLSEKRLVQGLILSFVLSNFCITAFLLNMTAVFYFLLLAVLLGARQIKR